MEERKQTVEQKLIEEVRTGLVGLADYLSEEINQASKQALVCLRHCDYKKEPVHSVRAATYMHVLEKLLATFPEIDPTRYREKHKFLRY